MVNRIFQAIVRALLSIFILVIFGAILVVASFFWGENGIIAGVVIGIIGVIIYVLRFELAKGNIKNYNLLAKDIVWKDKSPDPRVKNPKRILYIYKLGLRYLNYVVEWNNLKEMYYPKNLDKKINNVGVVLNSSYIGYLLKNTETLKIVDKKGKIYLVEILDMDGFENALKKIGKLNLLG